MANTINMVYLLSILGCIYCLTSEEVQIQFQECLDELKITKEKYHILQKINSTDLDCFYACIMEKRGSLVRGKADAAIIVENLNQLNISTKSAINEEKIRECVIAANTQASQCLIARDLRTCINSYLASEKICNKIK